MWRKNVMANEIAEFGDLNLFILNELTMKYVIEFGRFVRILEDQWKWYKGTIIFNVQQNKVICRLEEFF